ncbi:hypothetical protein E1B28_004813 [Marasmius oreades]|uniref:Uncharacterized protein n=1 Tax=Marasmius oreades TaxID=181124 RepID=A0A9P8ADM5_9AGAR|nr:uncharacterized protein E1B28_004813 [Marasmius oreades]KAG7097470.1 hypothetical protein E1B28_004813 [Marasmius oreades]
MVAAVRDLIEFSYLVRRHIISEDDILEIEGCVNRFHENREVFRECGIRPTGFSPLPRQHSLVHYSHLIRQFGAPNGLCSSITESKHIHAVKKPWRRSSRHKALGQMLMVNQRIDKLAAARVDFSARGMLSGSALSLPLAPSESGSLQQGGQQEEDSDISATDDTHLPDIMSEVLLSKTYVRNITRNIHHLGHKLHLTRLYELTRRYLYNRESPNDGNSHQVLLDHCPKFDSRVYVHHSARAMFYAPSDLCGIMGMHRERIRVTPSWRGGRPRRDCVFISSSYDNEAEGGGLLDNLLIARVFLFFSFKIGKVRHQCALVHWFSVDGDCPDPETGMWMATPDYSDAEKEMEVISVDSIFRAAHLIGCAGDTFLPVQGFDDTHSLDAFNLFYVNKYADYHAHEIAF